LTSEAASPDLAIRRATRADTPALGRLGAMLMRTHYAFDPLRFLAPGDSPEEGYAWFLGSQLAATDVVVLVAEHAGQVVGYVYAGIEPLSWKELRDEAGFIHDIAVVEHARRTGVAGRLLDAALAWLRDRGVPRVVLWTAEPNTAAQQLFSAHGFRRTMIEMTREL
jgi:ribosomal protein S18 acetylase RimI-like enzyme